jgi:hypothetical protein
MILPPPGTKTNSNLKPRRRPKLTLFGPDPFSRHYASRLDGVYDCIDRLTIESFSREQR